MKKEVLIFSAVVLGFTGPIANANESMTNSTVASAMPTVSQQSLEHLKDCLEADTQVVTSKSIRACSKALKAAVPNYELRSNLYTQRGLLDLSSGEFKRASRDFKSASKLDNQNEFADLGQGYAAIFEKDYDRAVKFFNDCASFKKTAPMAEYGLGIANELKGDTAQAAVNYKNAITMRPHWAAASEGLARTQS